MRKVIWVAVIVLATVAKGYSQKGVMKFKEESHNFGKVEQGKPVTHEFVFTNTGTEPVVVSKVEVSCGCTTPDFTRDPILPGKTGVIRATYNAAALSTFLKPLTVLSNSESPSITLFLKGEVVKKEVAAAVKPSLK